MRPRCQRPVPIFQKSHQKKQFYMKKLLRLFVAFIVLAAVVVIPTIAHAQDSTAVSAGSTGGVIDTIVAALELKWPVIATVGTILFVLSEALAQIKSVAANSVFELIQGVLSNLFGKKS
jgi:hypothetical protein